MSTLRNVNGVYQNYPYAYYQVRAKRSNFSSFYAVAAIGAIVSIASLFLPWITLKVPFVPEISMNGLGTVSTSILPGISLSKFAVFEKFGMLALLLSGALLAIAVLGMLFRTRLFMLILVPVSFFSVIYMLNYANFIRTFQIDLPLGATIYSNLSMYIGLGGAVITLVSSLFSLIYWLATYRVNISKHTFLDLK